MASKIRYKIQIHQLLLSQDLPFLSQQLQENFKKYQQVLALDPYETKGISSHNLIGKLKGCRALEIDHDNICYRLVYKVYESPIPKRVLILSFAEHDPAYEKAKERK